MDDLTVNRRRPTLVSKKFIAYMVTVPLLIAFLLTQVYVDYRLAVDGLEPLFTEDFMAMQLYIIGALVIVYIGGQAALDAVLGWIRGGSSNPNVVVVPQQHTSGTVAVERRYRSISPSDRIISKDKTTTT